MSDLLERLKASGHAIATVDLAPAGESPLVLGLRILTEQDYADAGFGAAQLLKTRDAELSLATADLLESEKASQLVALMVVEPQTKARVFASADEVRRILSREQRQAIMAAYLEHEKRYSPQERHMSDVDFAKLLEELKKTPEQALGSDLSLGTLKRLIKSLVSQPTS